MWSKKTAVELQQCGRGGMLIKPPWEILWPHCTGHERKPETHLKVYGSQFHTDFKNIIAHRGLILRTLFVNGWNTKKCWPYPGSCLLHQFLKAITQTNWLSCPLQQKNNVGSVMLCVFYTTSCQTMWPINQYSSKNLFVSLLSCSQRLQAKEARETIISILVKLSLTISIHRSALFTIVIILAM